MFRKQKKKGTPAFPTGRGPAKEGPSAQRRDQHASIGTAVTEEGKLRLEEGHDRKGKRDR